MSRWGCVAAICFGLTPQAEAAERSGLVHRASCAVVRFYVAKYSVYAAEMWARSHGATDAEIKTALEGLKCRCGTHMGIMRAVKRASEMMG